MRCSRARSSVLVVVVAVCAGAAWACGEDPLVCTDLDADGFGVGCVLGPDCDDRNAARIRNCESVPPPDCARTPSATGCPCIADTPVACYSGTPDTRGVGACAAGHMNCVHRRWGLCVGEVVPRAEVCDGVDQDCDGVIDEGASSPCGGCNSECAGGVWGESDVPFAAGAGLDVTPEGLLTLARETRISTTLWAANTGEGTLSKIDSASATEVGRYRTGGDSPSRVAVDYAGDVWVANRAFSTQGTVTKIAGELSHCIDRDGDGAIATSSGPSDVLPEGMDECVLFTVPVGAPGEVPRALAIDGDRGLDGVSGGDAWVGLHDGARAVELDGLTGDVRTQVDLMGVQPYAAHVDAWGAVWMAERDGRLARIARQSSDPVGATPAVTIVEVPLPCYLLYGLDGDAWGRLVMTGFSCDQLVLYDPATQRWDTVLTDPSPRGIVLDASGNAWVTHTAGTLSRFSRDGSTLRLTSRVSLASGDFLPSESIGAGLDSLGHVWAISTNGAPSGLGVATRLPLDAPILGDGEPDAALALGFAPHTQGDLTGASLRGGFVPEGEATQVFTGCADGGTTWLALHLTVRNGSASRVVVAARHAADVASLPAQAFVELGAVPGEPSAPWPLTFPEGGVVEVALRLSTSASDGAPRVERVGVEWRCPGPG